MIQIDGSKGEGGGQVIRTSLALSMITGKPFEIINVRGRRHNAGLARQHLTCVQAAQRVCSATVEGDQLRSSRVSFSPGEVMPGDYLFQIGTAGSTSLVAQTVLPALLTCQSPSTVTVEGGTHNSKAPPFDFLAESFVGVLNQMGPTVQANLESYGFNPAGGGRIVLQVNPGQWKGLTLVDVSKFEPEVVAIVSDLDVSIAKRECSTICRKANWPEKKSKVISVENPRGPGNIVMIKLMSDRVTEIFSSVGKIGVKAEHIARGVLREARSFLACQVPVGEHLADQIMLPMAIAAMNGQSSVYRTVQLSQHSRTHVEIIQRFLEVEIAVEEVSDKVVEIRIG